MSTQRDERADQDRGGVAAFGPFRLFPAARRLERDDKPVEIGDRALDVLVELVRHAGRVVSKAELMETIWADTTVVDGVLRTHVHGLRKALGDNVAGSRYVTSVAGRGYCFVAPVVRSAVESATTSDGPKIAHGLPPRLARMAGRDDAVRALAAQVMGRRFVTILGAAGIGKTTVAVAVGHSLLDEFEGALRFVELGSLTDPALVAPTVASMLGVPVQSDDAIGRLQAFVQNKRVLLVLDNCEHVAEAVALLAERLFLHTPRVHLLTTSREALRVEGEHTHRLGALGTPTEASGMDADTVQAFPAIQVFLERAAATGWSAELSNDDVPILAETCRRLDGVPLALELAASFVGQCGLRSVATLLDDRLRLLWQPGRRTAPPRHHTIHALIAWSYDRLPEHERAVLRGLSTFAGTFSFDAVKAVLEGGDSTKSLQDAVNELVAKSLVSASVQDGAVVYRLLETTRAYALERLAESHEGERMSLRHALFFTELMERTSEGTELGSFARQPSELANVRAALEWSFSSSSRLAVSARLAAATAWMFLDLGLLAECQRWCSQALGAVEEPDVSALVELRLQEGVALSIMWRGLSEGVRPAFDRALELARDLGRGEHEVRLLEHLNFFLQRSGYPREALEVAERSVVAARTTTATATATAAWMLARSHYKCGNQVLALEHCEAGMHLAEGSGRAPATILGYSTAQLCLAWVLWLRGRVDRALVLARELIREGNKLKQPVYQCIRLMHCTPIIAWHGERAEAQDLVGQLVELSERHALPSYRSGAELLQGKMLVESGRPEEGCKVLAAAMAALAVVQVRAQDTTYACSLAEGLAATGATDEALSAVNEGIELCQQRGGTWDLPELLRVKALVLAARTPARAQEVDKVLYDAIELAQRQGALVWELRAATTLARERLRRGRPGKVLNHLGAVYARFTEGLQAPDLQAARVLLEGARAPQARAQT